MEYTLGIVASVILFILGRCSIKCTCPVCGGALRSEWKPSGDRLYKYYYCLYGCEHKRINS